MGQCSPSTSLALGAPLCFAPLGDCSRLALSTEVGWGCHTPQFLHGPPARISRLMVAESLLRPLRSVPAVELAARTASNLADFRMFNARACCLASFGILIPQSFPFFAQNPRRRPVFLVTNPLYNSLWEREKGVSSPCVCGFWGLARARWSPCAVVQAGSSAPLDGFLEP